MTTSRNTHGRRLCAYCGHRTTTALEMDEHFVDKHPTSAFTEAARRRLARKAT